MKAKTLHTLNQSIYLTMNNEANFSASENPFLERELSPERKDAAASFHENAYRAVDGPQGEGLRYEAARAAMDDPRTIVAQTTMPGEQDKVDFIVFSPIEYTGDHSVSVLRDKYGDNPIYHFPYVKDVDYSQDSIVDSLKRLPDNAVVLFDYQDTHPQTKEVLYHLLDGEVVEDDFINSNNHQEASVTHYMGRYEPNSGLSETDPDISSTVPIREAFERGVAEGRYEKTPHDGVTVLSGEDLDRQIDGVSLGERMWSIYETQMVDWLLKEHPSLQAFDKDYFLGSLKHENTVTIANFVDGKPVCFLALNDIKDCFWLNQEFYGSDHRVIFCPGIVADKNSGHAGTSLSTIKFYGELEKEINSGVHFATQCTEISREYIPKIIGYATQRAGLDFKLEQLATYKYAAFRRIPTA